MSEPSTMRSAWVAEPVPERPAETSPIYRISILSGILRFAGGALLLIAAFAFLLQRWDSGGDLVRYAMLFGLTTLLAAAGLFCAEGIGESKAARTFLTLSMAMMPVHAAVLGGLVYSRFTWDRLAGDIPRFGVWVAPSDLAALVTPALALALLVPIVHLAARALTPGLAPRVTALVFATNLPLLLPLRGGPAMALLVAVSVGVLLTHELRAVASTTVLRTPEGRLVRLLLAAPLAVIVGRATLYAVSDLFLGTVCLTGGVAIFSLARRVSRDDRVAAVFQWLSLVPAAAGWLLIALALEAPADLSNLVVALPVALLLVLASVGACRGAGALRQLGAAIGLLAVGGNLIFWPSVGGALAAILVGLAVVAYGFFVERRPILVLGVASALLGVGFQIHFVLEVFTWSRWGGLAALGVAILLAAAVLERHRARFHPWALAVGRRLRGWKR